MVLFWEFREKKIQNGPKNHIYAKNGKKPYKYPIFFLISS